LTGAIARRAALALTGFGAGAAAQEPFRYPPPELGPEYVTPETAFPPVRDILPPWADVVVLALAIGVASWLAHRTRSRRGLWVLAAGSLAWFGFIREGCVCPVGSVQNVAQALADPLAPILTTTVLFFVLPLAATLLFGRTFCASVCPLGAIQELLLLRPTTVPSWLAAGLGILPVVYLALALLYASTGSAYVICRYDPFVGLFRFGATWNMLVVGGSIVLIGVFVGRPYCRFLCPYGVLLGWASKLSWKRVTVSPDACAKCRLCEEVCPYGAIDEPNLEVAIDRRPSRRGLVTVLALAPLIVLSLAWAGGRLGPLLATGNATVWLARQVEAEESGLVRATTDATDAWRASGARLEDLRASAGGIEADFVAGGRLCGALVGLVIALKLIGLSVYRRRPDYDADRERCLACGRCFSYCPVELERRGTGQVPVLRA
jgi:ferredoxin